LLAGTALNVV